MLLEVARDLPPLLLEALRARPLVARAASRDGRWSSGPSRRGRSPWRRASWARFDSRLGVGASAFCRSALAALQVLLAALDGGLGGGLGRLLALDDVELLVDPILGLPRARRLAARDVGLLDRRALGAAHLHERDRAAGDDRGQETRSRRAPPRAAGVARACRAGRPRRGTPARDRAAGRDDARATGAPRPSPRLARAAPAACRATPTASRRRAAARGRRRPRAPRRASGAASASR